MLCPPSPAFLAAASKALRPGPLPSPPSPRRRGRPGLCGGAGGSAPRPAGQRSKQTDSSPAPARPRARRRPAPRRRIILPAPRAGPTPGGGQPGTHPAPGCAEPEPPREAASGGSERPCGSPVPRPRSRQPGPAAALSAAVPAPARVAPEPAPARRRRRRVSRALRSALPSPPQISGGGPGQSGDGGGLTRASSPWSGSRPPPSYSRSPPPGPRADGQGTPRARIHGQRERRGGSREAVTQPANCPPRVPQQPLRAGPAPGTHCVRAHRTHLPGAGGRRRGRGGVSAPGRGLLQPYPVQADARPSSRAPGRAQPFLSYICL